MSNDSHRQGPPQPPHSWSSSQPPPSQYPVHHSQLPFQYYPPSQQSQGQRHPDMATIQPHMQHAQGQYPLPPPHHGVYQPPPEVYPPPPPPQAAPVVYQAAAPRQRTAIACRYCRRRKIRCSGFDTSQDGRCSNCVRFNQDCMFTPVSSQTQAFVPAHAAYPHLRGQAGRGGPRVGEGVTLYGPHGHPLPQQGPPPPPPGAEQGMYPQPQPAYGRPPVDERGVPLPQGHYPPPHPQDPHQPQNPRDPGRYEGPTLPPVSAAASGSGYPPPQPSPSPSSAHGHGHYYPGSPQDDRRLSSHSGYDQPSTTTSAPPPRAFPGLHPGPPTSQPSNPSSESGPTPPPGQQQQSGAQTQGTSRPGLAVRDMLGPSVDTPRSSTDSDMLSALDRGDRAGRDRSR